MKMLTIYIYIYYIYKSEIEKKEKKKKKKKKSILSLLFNTKNNWIIHNWKFDNCHALKKKFTCKLKLLQVSAINFNLNSLYRFYFFIFFLFIMV